MVFRLFDNSQGGMVTGQGEWTRATVLEQGPQDKVHLCVLQGAWGGWSLGLFLCNWPLALLKE